MFEPNRTYNVRVASAYLMESQKKTAGIELSFHDDIHGEIVHTLWLTPNTAERVRKDLETLGVKEEVYSRDSFLENCGDYLTGKECSITTFEEEYNGKRRVKVQWINKPTVESDVPLAKRAAALLSGKPVANDHGADLDSSDVPF